MSRSTPPHIITANALMEGDVVYLAADGRWSRFHEEAAVFTNEDEAKARLGEALRQEADVVGPYLAEVTTDDKGQPKPLHFREAFRTRGPSNYFHGKQAEA